MIKMMHNSRAGGLYSSTNIVIVYSISQFVVQVAPLVKWFALPVQSTLGYTVTWETRFTLMNKSVPRVSPCSHFLLSTTY